MKDSFSKYCKTTVCPVLASNSSTALTMLGYSFASSPNKWSHLIDSAFAVLKATRTMNEESIL